MIKLWRYYLKLLERHPWKTKSVTTGVLMAAGDTIAQVFVENKTLQQYDGLRTCRYLGVGLIIVGPTFKIWYNFVEKFVRAKGTGAAFQKMFLDQGLFAPVFIVGFLALMAALRGETKTEIPQTIKRVWPLVQLTNFYYVPVHHRILFINMVSLLWNTYLAYKAEEHGEELHQGQQAAGNEREVIPLLDRN